MNTPWSSQVRPLVEQIRPILANNDPMLQSAVLADLLAMWVAGFSCPDDANETEIWREQLLESHIELVRQLIPINARIIGT